MGPTVSVLKKPIPVDLSLSLSLSKVKTPLVPMELIYCKYVRANSCSTFVPIYDSFAKPGKNLFYKLRIRRINERKLNSRVPVEIWNGKQKRYVFMKQTRGRSEFPTFMVREKQQQRFHRNNNFTSISQLGQISSS